jgi:hypothetical protein
MKRAVFLLFAVILVAGLTGCAQYRLRCRSCGTGSGGATQGSHANCPNVCRKCGGGCRNGLCRNDRGAFAPGPPTGAVTYPYYTTHGPRDFLAGSPRPLGP